MYGLTLLVAILACIWLTGKRWTARGGDWDLVTRVAVWGVRPIWPITGTPRSDRNAMVSAIRAPPSSFTAPQWVSLRMRAAE